MEDEPPLMIADAGDGRSRVRSLGELNKKRDEEYWI